MSKIIYAAAVVVMPEYNRATLYQIEYQLERRPAVLPNKPYYAISSEQILELKKKYEKELALFFDKKVILYQGIIHKERDLTNYIKAVEATNDDFVLVLLGPDCGALESYKNVSARIIHIDFIPAPDYLIFTMNAYIGIVTYESKNLNCAYCAPNKIFEYSKYGLPMIGNDIPGLKYSLGAYSAGVIVDENSPERIAEAIMSIDNNYEWYQSNSRKLFFDTDNEAAVKSIIAEAKGES